MTFTELRNKALSQYYPALALERLWPRGRGRHMLKFFRTVWAIMIVLTALSYSASKMAAAAGLGAYFPHILGGLFLSFGFWMAAAAIHAFYLSYYYRSFAETQNGQSPLSFELARIVYQTSRGGLLSGFIESDEGSVVLKRLGFSEEEVDSFLGSIHDSDIPELSLPDSTVSVEEYVAVLFDAHKKFADFLFAKEIQKRDLVEVVRWVVEREAGLRLRERWWSRARLERIPSIGKGWSYGQAYNVAKYSREVPVLGGEEYDVHDVYGSEELVELESVLSKDRSANAVIVGDDNEASLHIISRLLRRIETDTSLRTLSAKRLIMLDTDKISAASKTKSEFESLVISIFTEAQHAGNLIVVLADFPAFILTADTLGSDLSSLLQPFLTSSSLEVIALSDADRFHSKIERNIALMEHFEIILVKNIDEQNTLRVLENEIISLERSSRIFFTYPALRAITDCAERYFTDGVMPDKAVDLLYEIAPKCIKLGKNIVRKDDVLELVKTKTGIPVGKVNDEERDRLLHLEDLLHHRIIGQDEAVVTISNAVRRARSGINNPDRPLGSFLFLGPTGVGKTETTKVLAEIFFGKNAVIDRLDMSEYSGTEALQKLIGSFEGGKSGVLASMLREHPYGVLLLDEFEKTTPEVMNLFLQILDEGFFSDMAGKKVNARNLLIIATSNAGSDMIWDAVKKGEDLTHAKELIVDSIVKAHVMKPELINRFDGVIVFHPLSSDQLEKIARLQLEKLSVRLRERGIRLQITNDLVAFLVKHGSDPKFGARPMNRAIQDNIEQAIANKMIAGSIASGAEVSLTAEDLESIKH